MSRVILPRLQTLVISSFLVLTGITLWKYVLGFSSEDSRCQLWSNRTSCTILEPNTNIHITPQRRRNVAVASKFGYHFDVYMALAWTFERVMQEASGQILVYASQPFYFNFDSIVNDLGLYHGEISHHDNLIRDLNHSPVEGGIDMVVLGTCETECVRFPQFIHDKSHLLQYTQLAR